MSDLISKADVLETLDKKLVELDGLYLDGNPDALLKSYAVNWARIKIGDMPSAEPERKTGKKIVISYGRIGLLVCDQCGEPLHKDDNYCSNCGAKMEVEE